jgi:DNA-binding protein YbaB
MSVFSQQFDDLMAGYLEQLKKSDELRRKIGEISATVTAPAQAVKVTVGARGDVRALEFLTGAYKRMTPAELSDVLLTTINQAKDQAQTEYSALMNPQLPAGLTMADLLKGDFSFAAKLPQEPPVPDAVKAYLDDGYRTEIGARRG